MKRALIAIALAVSVGLALFIGASLTAAAQASTTPGRLIAFYWARTQAGKPYEWGGTGPYGYDCSGIVYRAYGSHSHIWLPRTTTGMLGSGMLIPETESTARKGDLAFYGSGHVEFFVRPGHTFGALESGTLLGWHATNSFWHPTMFFRVRGAG